MTPREIAKDVLSTLMDWFSVHMEAENQKIFLDYLERKILADRQAHQSQTEEKSEPIAYPSLKMIPSSADPDRISALHQIIGQQAETIRKLKEENRVLRESLAHFEHLVPDYHPGEGSADRKD